MSISGLYPPLYSVINYFIFKPVIMTKRFLLLLFVCVTVTSYSQEKTNSNKLGFSIPIIWNKSNGVYYSLGSHREPSGNAVSHGVNINYSHFVYKKLFIIGGLGFYKQRFKIKRPFEYKAPDGSEPLVHTEKYSYNNIQLLIGVGYQKMFKNKWSIDGHVSYNIYNSYRQKYEQEYFPGRNEIYKKNLPLGNTINFGLEMERYLNNKISIGAGILLPIYTHWNNDEIFYKYDYADDTQKIARTKFSLGANVSFYYRLKH